MQLAKLMENEAVPRKKLPRSFSLGKRKNEIPLKFNFRSVFANTVWPGCHRPQLCLGLDTELQLAFLPGTTAALGGLLIRLSTEKILSQGGHQTEIRLEEKE